VPSSSQCLVGAIFGQQTRTCRVYSAIMDTTRSLMTFQTTKAAQGMRLGDCFLFVFLWTAANLAALLLFPEHEFTRDCIFNSLVTHIFWFVSDEELGHNGAVLGLPWLFQLSNDSLQHGHHRFHIATTAMRLEPKLLVQTFIVGTE
jgi:hypothetical protein